MGSVRLFDSRWIESLYNLPRISSIPSRRARIEPRARVLRVKGSKVNERLKFLSIIPRDGEIHGNEGIFRLVFNEPKTKYAIFVETGAESTASGNFSSQEGNIFAINYPSLLVNYEYNAVEVPRLRTRSFRINPKFRRNGLFSVQLA